MLLLRAEFGRALRRRAVAGLGVMALLVVVGASSLNHALIPESTKRIEDFEPIPLQGRVGGVREGGERIEMTAQAQKDIEGRRISLTRKYLGPAHSHLVTLGLLGTGWGIALAVLLAATLFGAEFRWGYWKSLLLFQPSRWRVFLAKYVVLFSLLLFGLTLLTAFSYPVNWLFSRIHDVGTGGSLAAFPDILREIMRAWLTTSTFAGLAAAITVVARLSLAGAAAVMGLIFLDGSLASSVENLAEKYQRSLTIRVADLFYSYPNVGGLRSFSWVITHRNRQEELVFPGLPARPGPPPDQMLAIFLLLVVLTAALLFAWAVVSRRDVPT